MLKRGTDSSEIATRVDAIVRSAAPNKGKTTERTELLILLCRLIIQKRDCRNGGGEKDVVFDAIMALRKTLPETAMALVHLLPTFGYFKDLTLLATKCKESKDEQLLTECVTAIAAGIQTGSVLACKWAPREKKSAAWLADLVRRKLQLSKANYRKTLSKVMKENAVNVPEVLMSSKRFREIEPTKIPSRCLKVHRRAFLDEDKNGARRHVADVRKNGAPTDLQRQTMNAMWAAIVVEVKKQIAEQKAKDALAKTGETKDSDVEAVSFDPSLIVPMADVSGSMACCNEVPMNNSIALSLLLAEVGHPAFRGRILTLHTKPTWV